MGGVIAVDKDAHYGWKRSIFDVLFNSVLM